MKTLLSGIWIFVGLLIDKVSLAGATDPHVVALKIQLNLSERQAQELNEVFIQTRDKSQVLRKKIIEIDKKKRARIDAVLTAEQKKKYQNIMNPRFTV
ncbi:hypothetical protein CRENPOLYSF2_1160021 [Crenothrix polyspora]|uniref:Uncharacterized protein n=1 Tax=Crenothrix polyspora TaxID=360316 RepID=A0A1R4GZQ5_9GAMM|nr:hypothetical protein [Crenothrix polyspora]SJM89446.1 hypothetical protein CRENPOLYSF2_1160021 [Crenothrix polyspora]